MAGKIRVQWQTFRGGKSVSGVQTHKVSGEGQYGVLQGLLLLQHWLLFRVSLDGK